MELWLEAEVRMRREDVLHAARSRRAIRLAESGRSSRLRAHLADGAQRMSEALAALAQTLRTT